MTAFCRRTTTFLPLLGSVCLTTLTALFSSCSDTSSSLNTGTGHLSLGVEIDNTFVRPDGSMVESIDFFRPELSDVSVYMSSSTGEYSHVWTSFADFPQGDVYFAGAYALRAFTGFEQEGFDRPYYRADGNVAILAGQSAEVALTLRPESTANVVTFASSLTDYFTSVKANLHTSGGGYYEYIPDKSGVLYLLPGTTSLFLNGVLPDGRQVGYKAVEVADASSATLYEYDLLLEFSDGGDPVVTCKVGQTSKSQTLSEEFVSATPPQLTPVGWTQGQTYVLPEGEIPNEPVKTVVTSSVPLSHLYLTVSSAYLNSIGLPKQCDLLSLSAETAALLDSCGLKWSSTPTVSEVDFTNFLGSLVFLNEIQSENTFCLVAEDEQGRVGEPMMTTVRTTPMDIVVSSVPPVMIGATSAEIEVGTLADDFTRNLAIEIMGIDGKWTATEILSIDGAAGESYKIRFAIPESNVAVRSRLLYCQEVRAEVDIKRFMPDFTLKTDAFATYALVGVEAADAELTSTVVKWLDIYINGQKASVLERNTSLGVIVLTNLSPSTTYSLTSTMFGEPSAADFTAVKKFTTESTPALPNSDFEDRDKGIKYSDLPSGGRYSQTTVAIFNWQNKQSFDLLVPEGWANTNAKTFSRRSSNHNTWYMQPSVFTVDGDSEESGFAVCLRSVAFDLNGEEIPDYTQTGEPYLKYSPIVPAISSRAAGKLFLGSYSFNPETMEETYNDVVAWKSRPMSLSGVYKYNPSPSNPSDCGLAIIEVYGNVDGKQTVIGSATARLPIANGFTAFQALVTYERFGVKATGLKVMFASSESIGTIAEESASVITTSDPVSGASVGSTLWLDHVSLSY